MSFLLDILSGVLANTISDTSYIPITQGTLCLSILKSECIPLFKPETIGEAQTLIDSFITFYTHERIQLNTKAIPHRKADTILSDMI